MPLVRKGPVVEEPFAWNDQVLFVSFRADFHSVQNVARSSFSERFLLNCKQSSGTNLISCGWLHTFQKKALAKNRSHDILHWMEIRLKAVKDHRFVHCTQTLGWFNGTRSYYRKESAAVRWLRSTPIILIF